MKSACIKLHPKKYRQPKPPPSEILNPSAYDELTLYVQVNALRYYTSLRETEYTGFLGNPEARIIFMLDTAKFLNSLPQQQHRAAIFHYGFGYTIEQTARIMGRNPRTITKILTTLKETLYEGPLTTSIEIASGLRIAAKAKTRTETTRN